MVGLRKQNVWTNLHLFSPECGGYADMQLDWINKVK